MARNLLRAGNDLTVLTMLADAPAVPAEDGLLFVLAPGPPAARARCEPVFAALHVKGEAMLAREFPPSFPLAHARKDAAGHGDEDMSAVFYASAAGVGART